MRQNYHNSFAIDCDYASAEIALNIANSSGRLWNATSSSILVDQVINHVVRGNAFYNHFSNYGKDLMYSHMLREALGRYYL